MPLVDWLEKKLRRWRADIDRSEEARKNVFKNLQAEEKHEDYKRIAFLLWEADGKPENCGDRYYLEARKKLAGFRWRLYQLNKPFIKLEKKIIEPLDSWSDRANIFNFFSKLSPIIEAIGVLAIPFVILLYEGKQEKRQQEFEAGQEKQQQEFEENLILSQAEVRQQQAVRDYLSQVTTIHLESDFGKKLKEDKELQTLLKATTLALFNELSVREDYQKDSKDNVELGFKTVKYDKKGQVIEFLSDLSWIKSFDGENPLLSLSNSNLSNANLNGVNLEGVDLTNAKLEGANLSNTNLERANLDEANLERANLEGANLEGAKMKGVNLSKAKMKGVNLIKAKLLGAYLMDTSLEKANLDQANMLGAYLKKVNLNRAYLGKVNLEEVYFCEVTMPDGKINDQDCSL